MVSGSGAKRARLVLMIALGLVAAAALCVRLTAIAEPLGIDQGLWASAARGLSRGQRLYRDVWEQRPPGIYWIYLAGFRAFGWTTAAVAWLDILAAIATTALLFQIIRALSTALAGALGATLYAALTLPAWLYGHDGFLERSVCETFIVVAVALAAWMAIVVLRAQSPAAAAVLGLAAGAAVVLKPNAGLYFPALLLWLVCYTKGDRQALVAPFVAAGLGFVVLPAAAIAWLWRMDVLHEARVAVISFNRFYVSEGFHLGAYTLAFSKAVWLRMKTDPLWLGGTAGSVVALWDLARRRRLPPLAGLGIILGAAAFGVIVVNGAGLFNSYFINALMPLTMMATWLIVETSRGAHWRRPAAVATGVLMMALLVGRGYVSRVSDWASADLGRLRGTLDVKSYLERFGGYGDGRGYSALANAQLAQYVRAHTTANDRIFLFGINGADVYFASDRLPAQRLLRVNFFVHTDFPNPRFRLAQVLADLAARRPRYIIFERLHSPSAMGRAADRLQEDPQVRRLLSTYVLDARIEDFTLYRAEDAGEGGAAGARHNRPAP